MTPIQPTTKYITPSTLIEDGWTRTLIQRLLGEADQTAINSYHKSGPRMRLYKVSRVLDAEASPEFQAWIEKKRMCQDRAGLVARQARERWAEQHAKAEQVARQQRERWAEGYRLKYVGWEAALPDGCAALFRLNRYTKSASSSAYRDEVYRLKNRILELLYRHGYCTECYEHHRALGPKYCFGCDGAGSSEHVGGSGAVYGDNCYRCNGTGIFRPATTLEFVCFRFNVEGTSYCWHQPKRLVKFGYRTTQDVSSFEAVEGKEQVELSRDELAAATDLLNWIDYEATKKGEAVVHQAA
ncbi:MAG: hypothetical protein LC114_04615 [Bryobacterales bacterium]|nr:hypothetical protein [Bryobacterales bacterium]